MEQTRCFISSCPQQKIFWIRETQQDNYTRLGIVLALYVGLDNGPKNASQDFFKFAREYDFSQVTSITKYP